VFVILYYTPYGMPTKRPKKILAEHEG